ncbi:MAG: nicotinamide-nucleotide amidohydrolase family protein, partial [Acidobacteria bacterium]|nr:nicotinamide-nucleotide amidohydrolase family protein [Acidobacteriota bacterium]
GAIQVHLRARCGTTEEAECLLEEVCGQITPLLGDRVYTSTGEALEQCIGRLLLERGATVSAAESCTGGLLAERITGVAGSSNYFEGGFITYSDELKERLLGIPAELLRTEGAVSEPAAREMALGCRRALGTTYALSVTGFAGPDGGTEANPVGTVYVGLASPDDCEVKRLRFPGDRTRIRSFAAQAALDMLRRKLIGG